jgi:hypothetical protein
VGQFDLGEKGDKRYARRDPQRTKRWPQQFDAGFIELAVRCTNGTMNRCGKSCRR